MLNERRDYAQYSIIFNFLLLLVPYCGSIGFSIYNFLGKYYYAAVFAFTMIVFIVKYWAEATPLEPHLVGYKGLFKFAIVNMIYAVIILLASNLDINECIMLFITLIYACIMSLDGVNDRTLRKLGGYSMLMWLVQLLLDLRTPEDFNYNTYAFILVLLMGFSLFYIVSLKSSVYRVVLSTIMTGITLIIVEKIFASHTQLLGVIVIYGLFMVRELQVKIRTLKWLYTLLAIGVILLPIGSVILIHHGILDETFITSRGERWVKALDAIDKAGLFHVAANDPGTHNGFLGIAIAFTLPGALLFLGGMIIIMNSAMKNITNNGYSYVIVTMLCYYTLINLVESFYMSLNYAGFTSLIIAILVGRTEKIQKIHKTYNDVLVGDNR